MDWIIKNFPIYEFGIININKGGGFHFNIKEQRTEGCLDVYGFNLQ